MPSTYITDITKEQSTNNKNTSTSPDGPVPDDASLKKIIVILKDNLSENAKLRKSVENTNAKLNEQTQCIDGLLQKVTNLENDNKKLAEENEELKLLLDDQERYSHRNCVELYVIPETSGENVTSEVIKVGRALCVTLDPDMIDNYHRLGSKQKKWHLSRN